MDDKGIKYGRLLYGNVGTRRKQNNIYGNRGGVFFCIWEVTMSGAAARTGRYMLKKHKVTIEI